MFNRVVQFIFSLLVLVSLISCGGGGSAGSEGGIGGTGVSGGRVTGFGSIIVNGVHFDTTGAVVIKDDGPAETNSDDANINTLLSEGMVVTVEGNINDDGISGTADKITYQDKLEGPVVGTPANGSFVALGQTVVVSSLTRYSGGLNTLTDINDRHVVEVSGFYDTNGNIIATFIEKKANDYAINTIFEIKGIAMVVGGTLTIGALTIDTTIDTTGFNQQFVEVYGTFNGVDTLTANSIEIKTQGFNVGNKQYAELEGIATDGCTVVPCDFKLNGVTIRVNSSTQFKAGLITDIDAGVFIEAEGSLQGNILTAHEIDFKDKIEIDGEVESKGTDTVVINFGTTDITVKVDSNLTEIRKCGSSDLFSEINGPIAVRARQTSTEIVATRLECGGTAGEVYIQAQVENIGTDNLTLLGLVVDTSTVITFEDSFSNPIDRTTFYNTVNVGDLVEVIGTMSGGTVTWTKAKLDL
jgi:hypothetical protein